MERKTLLNKVELSKIDLTYKTQAYISAYTVLNKLKTQLDQLPADHPVVARMNSLMAEWTEKDEAHYQEWNKTRQEARRKQRANRKSQLRPRI